LNIERLLTQSIALITHERLTIAYPLAMNFAGIVSSRQAVSSIKEFTIFIQLGSVDI
jgi:hypothetical protein